MAVCVEWGKVGGKLGLNHSAVLSGSELKYGKQVII